MFHIHQSVPIIKTRPLSSPSNSLKLAIDGSCGSLGLYNNCLMLISVFKSDFTRKATTYRNKSVSYTH
ncbi:MAG: hypothetical protein KA974_00230, partial [Saprospiraceae bacterium]|nr:hypothetical protein [Saprospiraceae bacterium]